MVHRYIKSMFHKLSNIKKPHIAKKYTKDHMEYPYCVFSLRIRKTVFPSYGLEFYQKEATTYLL